MTEEIVDNYYESYKKAGFHFPTSILTTYAISLCTKPFVILSGISGTGKTKIAQIFDVPRTTETTKTVPKLSIRVRYDFSRFNFPQELLSEILEGDDLKEFNRLAKEFADRGDNGNFTSTYILTIEDEHGEFQIGVYGQRAESPLVRARFYKSNRDHGDDYDARDHLKSYYKSGDILKLEKIANKRFRVVSINDTEVVKDVRSYELETIERRCFISVRSDWTDNSELFGFYNLIEKKYHVPRFLNFVLTALSNPEYPFFVILDEMNLSKVEHYFSDILSCLESRMLDKDGVRQERVILHEGVEQLETDSDIYENIPNTIEIPLNLYITGTVNIDESTYMFSPKVLDRANVIEFNEVDLKSYGDNDYQDDGSYKLSSFPDFSKLTLATKSSYESLPGDIKKHLIELNNILKEYNLHFGYRTVNEIALYILNAIECIGDTEEVKRMALDYQLIQKIFPKFTGGYAALEMPLTNVLRYLSGEEELSKINARDTDFPMTIEKLQRMYRKLSTDGYTNFID